MLNNSNPGQAIYDPFFGSGSSLIAAETVGRVCLGMEIDPLFVDVSVRRWQAFTGKDATLLATGADFGTVDKERCQPEAGNSRKTEERDDDLRRSRPRRIEGDSSPGPAGMET